MYTVCPKCNLMLVVTSADLRAAHGHVRCGRCRNVFNALEALVESPPDTPAPAETEMASESAPPAPEAPPPHESSADAEPASEHAAAEDVWIQPESSATSLSDDTIEAEAISQPDEPEPEGPQPADVPAPATPTPAAEPSADERHAHDVLLEELAEPAGSRASREFEFDEPAGESRRGPWFVAALVLALVLVGQIVNHYRGTLATMPSVGPSVRAVYGALGIPIVPLWNVRAYQARQLGATVSDNDPHQITVRASIANQGHWPLPLPLLRVTLQDRYGRTIAARDVPPRDYLPASSSPSAMLAPGGRIDATVGFVNPGPQAIGFEIDACLRESASVVCAHGPH